jgi:hypothetical protein
MSRKRHSRHRYCKGTPQEELHLFLRQRGISARNIDHIQTLTLHPDAEVREFAGIVLAMAQVKPGRRGRLQIIARDHPDLFIDMVAVLDEEFWDDAFYRHGGQPEWLWEKWEDAKWQVRFHAQGKSPCWCGSGAAYWHCCADRDEMFAAQLAAEEQVRAWELNPETIPWWHPDSGVDHFTRSAYEMYYIDSEHPFALPPPECRDILRQENAGRKNGQFRQGIRNVKSRRR